MSEIEKAIDDHVKKYHARSKRFVKPTPKEVNDYGMEIGYIIDGQQFCDFYESKGWMVGKTKMKDWKAAVRTWKSNNWGRNEASPDSPKPKLCFVDKKPATTIIRVEFRDTPICDECLKAFRDAPATETWNNFKIPKHSLSFGALEIMILKQKAMK